MLRCLAKHPRDRFSDGRALADALARCSVAGTWRPAANRGVGAPSLAISAGETDMEGVGTERDAPAVKAGTSFGSEETTAIRTPRG